MTEQEFRRLAEAGQIKLEADATPVHMELREERVTVRFTEQEIRAIDREAVRRGLGRSSLIRMFVRKFLEQVMNPTPKGGGLKEP
ncbi:MAG: ribbon-helix-helix domain-containing protein [Sulfobacillus thermotolerans]|nr:ribbon-helix-helix domain-containing protein [Sulfobacillus thermotolerans]